MACLSLPLLLSFLAAPPVEGFLFAVFVLTRSTCQNIIWMGVLWVWVWVWVGVMWDNPLQVLKKDNIIKRNQVEHTKTERNVLEYIRHPFIVSLR